jgi:Fe-S cluster biogenesis protein NfuA
MAHQRDEHQLSPAEGPGSSLREQVERVLNMMRPAVQSDGGDLELVGVSEDGVVQVRFHGACVGCPSSTMTLQSGIERNLKQHIPGVRSVQAVA